MNRAQRRNQTRPKSTSRKVALTYLTAAGVVTGTLGLSSPAHADEYTSTDCSDLRSDLYLMQSRGGTLTATFTGNCDILSDFIFQQETTIIGPSDGELNLRFMDSASQGFAAQGNFTISNINFTRESNANYFSYFIYGFNPAYTPFPTVIVSNSKFSNAEVSAAIYAEGNLTVSDSTFENLTSYSGGVAIQSLYTSSLVVSNSTFRANESVGQGQGGTINSQGPLTVNNSTFDSNESDFQGGAIYALGGESKIINNSTFVGNSASTDAAVHFSEGGIISNSTFWNNGDSDTYSIGADSPSITYLFANILANDTPNTVKLIDPSADTVDLGANLYTDSSFNDVTNGEGSSKLVTVSDLKLSTLALNQSAPMNSGQTKTVAIGSGSIAENYYTESSSGAEEGITRNNLVEKDQRSVDRPIGAGYDVGAFELGETADPSPSETPETNEVADSESLADTGLETSTIFLGLIGVGLAAIFGGSVGLVRRKRKV